MNSELKAVTIRKAVEADYPGILSVAQNLPEWFDERARQVAIPTDIRHQDVFVAIAPDGVLGFITLYVSEGRLNIGWIGVRKSHRRRSIGQQLLKKGEERARAMGISQIAVTTLGDNVDYPPYAQTRSFYMKNGFVEYQRSTTDNPGCPEELKLVKPL